MKRKMMKKACCGLAAILLLLSGLSCNRYLDVKPDRKSFVPETLDDLEALLNNRRLLNGNTPSIIEALADNYYTTHAYWSPWPLQVERQLYVWAPEVQTLSAWQQLYQGSIYLSNVVLDLLPGIRIHESERSRYDRIKGAALFYRAYNFFLVAQYYCKPYGPLDRDEPGIPLRMTAAIAEPVSRNTIGETYDRIVQDLAEATDLLPETVGMLTEPSKQAAFAMLARVYLTMRLYDDALANAEQCLDYGFELIDFNDLQPYVTPFARFNKETIFFNYCEVGMQFLNSAHMARVDTGLYASYAEHDLRKRHFFRPSAAPNTGSYHFNCFEGAFDSHLTFNGPMSGELLLIRAECSARLGATEAALNDLNLLLKHRLDNALPFTGAGSGDGREVLDIVLDERRKELVNRGLRWSDIRRLNQEGAGITLRRELDGTLYELPPGDPRWVLLIPDEVIAASNMVQNKR